MTESATGIREFKMPDVGEGLTEAEILKWYVGPGDTVTDGQVVCEVETAKAAVELPIPFTGTVHELRFEEGTTVDVGTPIISVDTGGTPGAETAEAPAGVAAAESAAETAAAEDQADAGSHGEGRQPVLVGYGVSKSSTKRRPRKPSAGAGTSADANGAQGAAQPGASGAAAPAAPASASDSKAVQPTSGPELNGHS